MSDPKKFSVTSKHDQRKTVYVKAETAEQAAAKAAKKFNFALGNKLTIAADGAAFSGITPFVATGKNGEKYRLLVTLDTGEINEGIDR